LAQAILAQAPVGLPSVTDLPLALGRLLSLAELGIGKAILPWQ